MLLGLTKSSTFFSMVLSFGLYWSIWGWIFGLGIILAIYVHEMGHVYALHKLGIKASPPAFIPGVGAFVRMRQMPASTRENARVGLAGPKWGLACSLILFVVYTITGYASIGAITKFSAWVNLFNLLPIGPLDGGRGFSALSNKGSLFVTLVIGTMWYLTGEGLLVLLFIGSVVQTIGKMRNKQAISDRQALIEYSALVVILSLFTFIDVPVN